MARVYIPAPMRDLTSGQTVVEVDAATVGQAIDALELQFPGVRQRLCEGAELAPNLQVSIDDRLSTQGRRARVGPDSEVHFLPALGGG